MDLLNALVSCRGRQAFADICKGLSALHSNLICHSNLNSENLLIGNDGTCKISSLRSGQLMETETSLISMPDLSEPGPYISPERIQGQAGLASDIWSLSIILWEVTYHPYLPPLSREMQPSSTTWGFRSASETQYIFGFLSMVFNAESGTTKRSYRCPSPPKSFSLLHMRHEDWLLPPRGFNIRLC